MLPESQELLIIFCPVTERENTSRVQCSLSCGHLNSTRSLDFIVILYPYCSRLFPLKMSVKFVKVYLNLIMVDMYIQYKKKLSVQFSIVDYAMLHVHNIVHQLNFVSLFVDQVVNRSVDLRFEMAVQNLVIIYDMSTYTYK